VSDCCDGAVIDGGVASGAAAAGSTAQVLDRVEADVVIANTAAATQLYAFTIPAGLVAIAGQTLRLRLRGSMLCAIAGAPTFTLSLLLGGVAWFTDVAIGRTNNPVALPWRLDVELARKGALLVYGSAEYSGANATGGATIGDGDLGQTGATLSPAQPISSAGDDACDWSIAQILRINVTLAAADPNYSTTLRSGTLVLE
jgi:hypothetical protein